MSPVQVKIGPCEQHVYLPWIAFPYPTLMEQKHFPIPLTVLLVRPDLGMHQFSFTSPSYFWCIKSFWLIRPGRKSTLFFSGSQGFHLLFQSQWVCFLGILRLLHCKNHMWIYIFFFLHLFQKYLQLVQISFDICCLSKKRNQYWEFTLGFSSAVKIHLQNFLVRLLYMLINQAFLSQWLSVLFDMIELKHIVLEGGKMKPVRERF